MSRARATAVAPPAAVPNKAAAAAPPPQLGDRCPHCGGTGRVKAAAKPAAPAAPQTTRWKVVGGPGYVVPTAPNVPLRREPGGSFLDRSGVIVNLRVGDVVSLHAHGRIGIDRMLGRGIVLEPLD